MDDDSPGEPGKLRVLLVGHPEMVSRGLRDALTAAGDIRMVADLSSCRSLSRLWAGLGPDVGVMSMARSGLGRTDITLATVRSITTSDPGARIILMLDEDAPIDLILDAINSGALGLLTQSVSAEALRRAVHQVGAGHPTVCAPAAWTALQTTPIALANEKSLGAAVTNQPTSFTTEQRRLA